MALPSHMTLSGEKTGDIKGSCDQQGREDTIMVQAFHHKIHIPRDIQTGLAISKRQHNPFVITKIIDKSSPLLYAALCRGEHMKEVVLKWYRIAPTGNEEHYFTHTLENAVIVEIRPWKANCLDSGTEAYGDMEEVAFTYETIRWTWEPDGIEGEDSWKMPTG